MARISHINLDALRQWATVQVTSHPKDFTKVLADNFSLTRAGAATYVHQLEAEGFIVRAGSITRPTFSPGSSRIIRKNYSLPGVDESLLWERDFMPWVDSVANVKNILHHGFTEMVNNANDHSQGKRLTVTYFANAVTTYLTVRDDGLGVFQRVATKMKFDDLRLSLLELAKGKFTTDSKNHTGEGIFFTSQAFDSFFLMANGLTYTKINLKPTKTSIDSIPAPASLASNASGSLVYMVIRPGTKRTLREVFQKYEVDEPDDLTFGKTKIPMRLASIGDENLLSRSQAKRVAGRLEQFKIVELDFEGVQEIGQAFADELFRVFQNTNPDLRLIPINVNADVQRMIKRIVGSKN
jgi:STAS-like domain of unknown function (DUF4325)